MTQEQEKAVEKAVAKYGIKVVNFQGELRLRKADGLLVGTVYADGHVEQKYRGMQNLMGSLVRNAIWEATGIKL